MTDPAAAERIRSEISSNDVVVFMKGTPVFPQCGFSAQVVQIFSMLEVKFKAIDVLSDLSLRQGIKDYSNWPTAPQIYIKGEFIGGSDILREMLESGELQKILAEKNIPYQDLQVA
jgi:monothiol glutaredoxin